ncbi:hypothetical protein Aglo03_17340 [Actinokineospora globicatena]|uniref:Uncharacterized protein n=1 Tax=Actinokineospora globicatena TaxID=103729 RepID=A0A9W6V9F3_9PSEU|nr:hypothetical protein Aglo03_17340 [Actinokineospora globicatena]
MGMALGRGLVGVGRVVGRLVRGVGLGELIGVLGLGAKCGGVRAVVRREEVGMGAGVLGMCVVGMALVGCGGRGAVVGLGAAGPGTRGVRRVAVG